METTYIALHDHHSPFILMCGLFMNDDRLWDQIEAAGIHLSYRFGGWYASCEAGHFGPYANREDALAGLISELLERLHQVHATIEEHPRLLRHYRTDAGPEQN